MSYHILIIVGRLGKEPELRYTPAGQAVANFSLATNRQYSARASSPSAGERVKETIWFRVSCWGKQAEACSQYLHRGSLVLIEGRLIPDPSTGRPRIWHGKNGPGASFEVNASSVRFLSGREEGNGPSEEPVEEEIPF
jgi:single-strand DNA-binding protein